MLRKFSTRAGVASVVLATVVAGCGVKPKQLDDEREATYRVEVVEASFPERQKLAKRAVLEIAVKNVDSRAIPNVNLNLDGINEPEDEFRDAEDENPQDPQIVFNEYPKGSDTAYVNTWALGNLDPGQTKRFRFQTTALQPGPFDVRYRVQGGLDGKAKTVLADGGGPVTGELKGMVEGRAPNARVADDGETILREGDRIGPESR